MDDIPVSNNELRSFRSSKGILSQEEIDLILELSAAGRVVGLDVMLSKIANQNGTTMGELLVHARDAENRNAIHYAARGQSIESLEYLLDNRLFPQQPALRLSLLHTSTRAGENTALYAIRQRCSVPFLEHIIVAAGTPHILDTVATDGLGPVHSAAMVDAPEILLHLVEKYRLDPNQLFKFPATNKAQNKRDDDCDEDDHDSNTKDNSGTQHNAAPLTDPRCPVEGDTPIHLAARCDSPGAFEVLHSALGCDIWTVRNAAGQSAIEVASAALAYGVLAYLGRKPDISQTMGVNKRKQKMQQQGQQGDDEDDGHGEEPMEGVEWDEVDDEADFSREDLDIFGRRIHPRDGCVYARMLKRT
ncbi:hypothetical protein VTH82DRAFT_6065 [Thermothelomyces myriococcoides]